MLDLIEIDIREFEDNIYEEYINLFPKEEQRNFEKIKRTYENGIEKFYKIVNQDIVIGFFMLEKISENHPYYIDYFAVFKQHQNKGYGTQTLEKILTEIVADEELCLEIEKEDENDPITVKRARFYENLGFKKVDSEYLLYSVLYTPYIYTKKANLDKNEIDKLMFDYYTMNAGEEGVRKNCKIIR